MAIFGIAMMSSCAFPSHDLTVDVFSGRDNPTVEVERSTWDDLEELASSNETTPISSQESSLLVPALGFRGYTAEITLDADTHSSIRLSRDVLVVETNDTFHQLTGIHVSELFETVTAEIDDQVSDDVLEAIRES